MKVIIRTFAIPDKRNYDEPRYSTEVLVDGVSLGREYYGGEPEDATYNRDYNWVEPLLASLAKSLGAEVIEETVEKEQ